MLYKENPLLLTDHKLSMANTQATMSLREHLSLNALAYHPNLQGRVRNDPPPLAPDDPKTQIDLCTSVDEFSRTTSDADVCNADSWHVPRGIPLCWIDPPTA